MPHTFLKQPAENLDYDFDWTDWMPGGDSITSSTVVAAPAGITLGTKQSTATVVKQFISGGVDGMDYKITCLMTTAQGRIDEREILILVRDL